MSALCGFLNLDSAPADSRIVASQLERLKHLGPDGCGIFCEGPVALGHGLLSITPESTREHSPWRDAESQRVIAYDGRLDHRDDLCLALGLPPAERDLPDPELILRAHEKWGKECAIKLEGEFAFVLWDGRAQELFCAVDAFSTREFFYFLDARRFVFANAIRGVLAVPGVPRELDELTLACRLGGIAQPGERTLYAGINRLPGARTLIIRPGGGPEIHPYWRLAMEPEINLRRPEEYAEALREMIERAVRSALRTRHPVAAMLSGGLDSTGVACLAARELATHGQKLITVSNILPDGYQGSEWSREESGFIRDTLDAYPNMDPHWSHGQAIPVVEFDDAHYLFNDEPDGDTKSFRTRELIQRAEQAGARIMLGGLGGDMAASFRGSGHLENLTRRGHWGELVRQVRLQAETQQTKVSAILRREVFRPLMPRFLRRWNDRLRHPQNQEREIPAIHPEFAKRMGLEELRRSEDLDWAEPTDFRKLQVASFNAGQFFGANWTRPYCPRMESPQPLMDRRIWDWCHRVSAGEFIHTGTPRGLYRRALHDLLPETILQRTSKGWYAPDYQQRLAVCQPAINEFLAQNPESEEIWRYLHRPKVEETLRLLTKPESYDGWDNRYQMILCDGLRLGHFVSWLRRSG